MNALAARIPLGRNGLRVGPMAYGVAALGNLLRPVSQQEWEGAVPAAWESGVRYFDVAPHDGLGPAERRLGHGLRGRPRDEFLVSTKVSRLLRRWRTRPVRATTRGSMSRPTSFGFGTAAATGSLGLDRVDIAFVHDPDDSYTDALDYAFLPWKSSAPRA